MAQNRITVTRRSLLQTSCRAAALASVTAALPQITLWKGAKYNMGDLTADSFRPYQGSDLIFSRPVTGVDVQSGTVILALAQVIVHERIIQLESQHPTRYAKRLREPFSLVFELNGREPLGEGLHRLKHEDFSGCDLLLTQVSRPRADEKLLYEAVFG